MENELFFFLSIEHPHHTFEEGLLPTMDMDAKLFEYAYDYLVERKQNKIGGCLFSDAARIKVLPSSSSDAWLHEQLPVLNKAHSGYSVVMEGTPEQKWQQAVDLKERK